MFPVVHFDMQIDKNNQNDDMEIVIYSGPLRDPQFDTLISDGILFAIGSGVTVFLFLFWHLKSLFLSTFALINILLSFPLAYFIFRFIGQVTYFDTMCILVVFLILGIGADGIFVFVDAWKQVMLY